MREMVTSVTAYSIVLIFCFTCIKRINKGHFDFFDPGFLFLMFATLTFLPLSILVILWYDVEDFFPILNIVDLDLYIKTVNAHTILIASFTAGYFLLAKRVGKTDYFEANRVWYSKTWIGIGFFFIVLEFVMGSFNPGGLIRYPYALIQYIKFMSEIIALGVILSHFNSKRKAVAFVIVFGTLYMFLSNINFSRGDISEINRGPTFCILLGAVCYADMVKWKGHFFDSKLFAVLTIIALAGFSMAVLFERVVIADDALPSSTEIGLDIALTFEPIIFENAATVISWVDDGYVRTEAGRTYLLALEGFKPFGHQYPSLAEWYVWARDPSYAMAGGGYNFSAVAEGYLNGKFLGVLIQGVLLSFVAVLIRHIKYSKLLGAYRPFFYAPAVLQVLVMNRKEIKCLIGAAELVFISILCLVICYVIITQATVRTNLQSSKA